MSAPSIEPPKLPDLPIKEGPPDLPDLPKRPPSLAVGKRGGGPHLPSFANRKLRRPPGAPKPQAQTPLEQARSAPPAPKAPESLDTSRPTTPRHEAAQTQHELADALKKPENQAPRTFQKLGKAPKSRKRLAEAAKAADVLAHGQVVKLQGRTRLAGQQANQPADIEKARPSVTGEDKGRQGADDKQYDSILGKVSRNEKLTDDEYNFMDKYEKARPSAGAAKKDAEQKQHVKDFGNNAARARDQLEPGP